MARPRTTSSPRAIGHSSAGGLADEPLLAVAIDQPLGLMVTEVQHARVDAKVVFAHVVVCLVGVQIPMQERDQRTMQHAQGERTQVSHGSWMEPNVWLENQRHQERQQTDHDHVEDEEESRQAEDLLLTGNAVPSCENLRQGELPDGEHPAEHAHHPYVGINAKGKGNDRAANKDDQQATGNREKLGNHNSTLLSLGNQL
jgi:hypothetical protein